MSSVAIANQILNLNKPTPEIQKKGRASRMTNSVGELQLRNQQPDQQQLYHGFDGTKENPMFVENPGFSPVKKNKDNNFTHYRQNENINTIKIKNKKPYDGAPVKGGEQTAATDVLNEFRTKYSQDGRSLTPQNGMKPEQQQKYFRKFSPATSPAVEPSAKNNFSFASIDFEDPTVLKPSSKPPDSPLVEEVPVRNKDFNVDEVLNDYRNKRQKKGGDKPIPTQRNEEFVEQERIRNEQLNAKLSGYVYQPQLATPATNSAVNPDSHIYQSLKHIPTKVQEFYSNEPNQRNGSSITTEKEFNAWNEFRPQQKKGKPEKARYISKQPNDFHFGVLEDDTSSPRQQQQRKTKPVIPNDLIPDNEISSAAMEMFPDMEEEEERKQDFSINQVLTDYKSKHVYKMEGKKHEGQHEAILMKEQLREQNRRNMEREKVRMNKLAAEANINHPVKKEFLTSTQPTPRPMESDVGELVSPAKRQSPQPNDIVMQLEKRERMDVENWEAPTRNNRHSTQTQSTTIVQPMRDENIVTMEYSQPMKQQHVSSSNVNNLNPYEQPVRSSNGFLTPEPQQPVRQRAGSYRDDNGWTRASAAEKVNPGPTTQALDYFIRSPNRTPNLQRTRSEDQSVVQTVTRYEDHDFNRTASSRSNPNVTFTQKDGKDIVNEFKVLGDDDQMMIDNNSHTPQNHQQQTIYSYNGADTRNVKSRSEPNLFMSKEKQKNLKSTELNQLNFSKISSNLRRSRIGNSSDHVFEAGRKSSKNNMTVIENRKGPMNRRPSSRSRSTLGSSYNSITSFGSSIGSQPSKAIEKAVTTVTLAKNWSGRIVSTNKETEQIYDYGVNIPQTQNLNGLVFRNKKPIEHVEPTDRNGEALNSLNSLDRRLKNENKASNIQSIDPVQWMGKSAPTSPKSAEKISHFYRESKQPIDEMDTLCQQIKKSGTKEGQLMRVEFYEFLHKMTTVVNEIVKSLPKDLFPFKITPCSYQGDFEKKGLHKIDLYLNIEDLKEYTHQVNFLMKRDLAGYVILKSDNREKLKSFCAKNRDSGDWVLSATRLMVVFSYLINTNLRSQFEHDSEHRRKKIPFDAKVKFDSVSEHEVRLNISFPDNSQVFNVGLILALNVTDFPNVMDMNNQRTWPHSETKAQFVQHGVHLIAKPGIRNHGWGVSFLKTRKILLGICDKNQTATSILLALQVVNKSGLSNRDCDGLLLPAHFIMVLFWMYEKHQDPSEWTKENIGKRFLDIIIGMKRCLERRVCPDFFFPATNYFQNLVNEKREHLLQNINDVLSNPESFLGLPEHKVSNTNLNQS